MTLIRQDAPVPDYRGLEWLDGSLPMASEPWPAPGNYSQSYLAGDEPEAQSHEIRTYARTKPWRWPSRPFLFFSDMHADADAFLRSLVASGGVVKTGPEDADMALTPFGETACFIIGGDCFDKGPANLRLLRTLRALRDTGADLVVLVGNHDLRTYMGIQSAGAKDPRHAHLFVRMGKKTVPLFKEIFDEYLAGNPREWQSLSEAEIRRQLFPDADWYRDFPGAVRGLVADAQIEKELNRIREKTVDFEASCAALGLTLGMVYAALQKARALFTQPGGEFFWLFDEMKLMHQAGSFLMVHAGLDDQVAALLQSGGVGAVNAAYEEAVRSDLFELYNGPLGNAFRTKYRTNDFALTARGLSDIHGAGIYAVIHGHRNLLNGQRITLRSGLLNFECDASVDSGTRRVEGLSGPGSAVTIIHPDARVLGISADYPLIKDFKPTEYCQLTTII
jgi:hypothetical protein